MDLILAGRETACVVDDDLLLVVEVVPVQLLVLPQLLRVDTEREGGLQPTCLVFDPPRRARSFSCRVRLM